MKRTERIRHQIALYRRYLAEGARDDLALAYLQEIRRLEFELRALSDAPISSAASPAAASTPALRG